VERVLYFESFGFDVRTGRLTRDGADVALGRTAARVLTVLLEHRTRAVSQDQIRRTVWSSHVVDRGAVKGYISDLRAILGDDPRTPRFIASEDGGYRFVAPIARQSPAQRDARRAAVVGRDEALGVLRDVLERALAGQRRLAFVTGEAGIGKTTTVELFLEEAAASQHLLTGRGQCVEHSGSGMAYLPLLEALERLCRSDAGGRVLAVLRQHAPTWLAQLPAFPRAGPPGRPGAQRAVRHAGAALPGTRAGARAADGR
jgi:DNA-binding winged helix-turn-helix (wHTH) protein